MDRAVVLAALIGLLSGACGSAHETTTTRSPTHPSEGSEDAAPAVDGGTVASVEDDSHIPAWYDVQPLLADLRPEAIARATTGPLDALNLYDFDLSVDPSASAFRLDERVFFQSDASVPLTDVMLRIFADTPPDGDPPERLTDGHCVGVSCIVTMVGRDTIVVHPKEPLAVGGRLRIVLHVTGKVRTIDPSKTTMMAAATSSLKTLMPGAGGGDDSADTHDYGLLGFGDDILSFGNFYPVIARHHDNDWDLDQSALGDIGPDALSHVWAHVDLPAGYVVAASGATVHEETRDGRHHLDVVAGCMRDFALLASDKFAVAEREVDGVTIRSFFRASDRPTGEKVLDVGAWAFRDFQKRFGPYPYRKLDLAEEALVAGAGGVEFAGLVTVASMFYKPSGAPSQGGGLEGLLGMLMGSSTDGPMKASAIEFTTAHEVGHEWWHETVGSDSRKHPWQDEALAQFSAMLYVEDRYGAARSKREGDMNARMAYQMMRLLGNPDGAVDAPAGNQSQMAYGGLVYGKGPYYLVALRKQLGDAAFFSGLQSYVKQTYLGFASPHGLADAMGAASGKTTQVAALSHRWLDELHGDDDLGKATFQSVLGMATGGQGGQGASGLGALGGAGGSPDMQQLMKMLQGLGGGGGLGSPEMMKMLQQMLGQ